MLSAEYPLPLGVGGGLQFFPNQEKATFIYMRGGSKRLVTLDANN
jgi:hypothetical protein